MAFQLTAASRSTRPVISPMARFSSASATNTAGEMRPCLGWSHRMSASTPSSRPVARLTIGWCSTESSPRSLAPGRPVAAGTGTWCPGAAPSGSRPAGPFRPPWRRTWRRRRPAGQPPRPCAGAGRRRWRRRRGGWRRRTARAVPLRHARGRGRATALHGQEHRPPAPATPAHPTRKATWHDRPSPPLRAASLEREPTNHRPGARTGDALRRPAHLGGASGRLVGSTRVRSLSQDGRVRRWEGQGAVWKITRCSAISNWPGWS